MKGRVHSRQIVHVCNVSSGKVLCTFCGNQTEDVFIPNLHMWNCAHIWLHLCTGRPDLPFPIEPRLWVGGEMVIWLTPKCTPVAFPPRAVAPFATSPPIVMALPIIKLLSNRRGGKTIKETEWRGNKDSGRNFFQIKNVSTDLSGVKREENCQTRHTCFVWTLASLVWRAILDTLTPLSPLSQV